MKLYQATWAQALGFVFLVLIAQLAGSVAQATDAPATNGAQDPGEQSYSLSTTDVDVGEVYALAAIDIKVALTNEGTSSLTIDRILPRWAGTSARVEIQNKTLEPGESTNVSISIDGGDGVGRFSHIFYAFADRSDKPIGKIAVRGFADWIVDPASTSVDVGVVKDHNQFEKTLRLKLRPGVTLRLTRIVSASRWIDARIVDDGAALSIRSEAKMPWGSFNEAIVVETDSNDQKRIAFHIVGNVQGIVVPNMETIAFGAIREGSSPEQAVRLESANGKAFRVGDVTVTGARGEAIVQECVPASDSCKVVKLKLDEQHMGVAPKGVLSISFPEIGSTLPIPFGGAVIGKDTVVRDLEKEIEKSTSGSPSISTTLRDAVSTPKAMEMPVPSGSGPLLKWEVANESQIYGYEIYRARTVDGPFDRVTTKILKRLSTDARIPSIYRWRDHTTDVGNEYWYYVGVVYLNGKKEALNSPQKVISK